MCLGTTIWQRLLGIDAAPAGGSADWRFEFVALPSGDWALATLAAALLVILLTWFLYRREGAALSLGVCVFLASLRLLVLGAVLVMLLQPVLVFVNRTWVPSQVPVLLDVSASMAVRDVYGRGGEMRRLAEALGVDEETVSGASRMDLAHRALRSGLLETLAAEGEREVTTYAFGVEVHPLDVDSNAPPATSPATALGTALRTTAEKYREQPVSGMLLVTDGRSNSGEPTAEAASAVARAEIPVHVLVIGTEEGPRNVAVTALEADEAVFVRDAMELRASVQATAMEGQTVDVALDARRPGSDWGEIAREPVTFGPGAETESVDFHYASDLPGELEFRASVESIEDETSQEDNAAYAKVRVVPERMRILLVAGTTFPEVQFLRNALLRDTRILLSTWLSDADPDYEQPGSVPIQRLPVTQREMNTYDGIILFDPDPGAWPARWSEMLINFVGQAGGGLIFIAGERMAPRLFERPGDPALSWLKLLPVVREPGLFQTRVDVRLSARTEWTLDFTPEGRADPVLKFSDDPEKNDRILANLPGMYWHFPVTRAKPGAIVWARHGDPRMRNRYGRHVILATHLYGPGRTVFVGCDSTYRWRYLDESYFDLFWARMIDRVCRNKLLGGRQPLVVRTDRALYAPGDTVTLTARFRAGQEPGTLPSALRGQVEDAEDVTVPISLVPHESSDGLYTATLRVDRPGRRIVRVWTGEAEAGDDTRPVMVELDVRTPGVELAEPGADLGTCRSVAALTGGRCFDLGDLGSVADAFTLGRVERRSERREEIWDAPVWLIAIVCLLFTEWVVRKVVRLP